MKYVIKIGTSSLFDEDGIEKEQVLEDLLKTVRRIFDEENEVVLVVSGAVGCGKRILKQLVKKIEKEGKEENNTFYKEYKKINEKIEFIRNLRETIDDFEKKGDKENPLCLKCKELLEQANLTTEEKSIIAGIGQTEMMRIIQNKAFEQGILVEQMLLSGKKDLKRSIAVKNIKKCFKSKILAVVNANDTVYEEELADEENQRFSDNDMLASDLARVINADRLFLITNVDGYLDCNNNVVKEITVDKGREFLKRTRLTKSSAGTGGMYSKLGNALAFAKSGGIAFILSVRNISNILEVGELKRSAGTKVCKKIRLSEKINEIIKNNIEAENIGDLETDFIK